MSDRGVWWVSLATEFVTYRQVKVRKVVAQGWPQLGDLSDIVGLASDPDNRSQFETVIRERAAEVYGSSSVELDRAPGSLWRLLRIQAGDLVVAAQGTTVVGLAQVPRSGWEAYQFEERFSYAQAVGGPVEWIDWSFVTHGPSPAAPRRLLGVKAIGEARERILDAWTRWEDANE